VQMNVFKFPLIASIGCNEKLRPKVWAVLPAESQLTCIISGNRDELSRRQWRYHLCDGRRHAERQARNALTPFSGMPSENHGFLRELSSDLRRPWRNGGPYLRSEPSVRLLRRQMPPLLVCEVQLKGHKWNMPYAPSNSGIEFRQSSRCRQIAG
jgi:hypothetical protein